jgi:hypothetical protein
MVKTLLDFITGCVTPSEARQFHVALGAPPIEDQGGPPPHGPDPTQKLIDGIRNIYKEPNGPIGRLYKKLFQKDPLDLTPAELTRLTQVIKDRQEDMDIRIELSPDLFNSGKIPPKDRINRVIADFFQQNKQHFDRARDLQYEPERYMLTIHTRRRLVKAFLQKLDFKSDIIRKIEKGLPLPGVTHQRTYTLPIQDLLNPQKQNVTSQELNQMVARMNAFLAAHKGGSVKLQNATTPKDAVFIFSGSLDVFKKLLTEAQDEKKFPPLFVRPQTVDDIIHDLEKQNPKGRNI